MIKGLTPRDASNVAYLLGAQKYNATYPKINAEVFAKKILTDKTNKELGIEYGLSVDRIGKMIKNTKSYYEREMSKQKETHKDDHQFDFSWAMAIKLKECALAIANSK